jgi:hypothetical protein
MQQMSTTENHEEIKMELKFYSAKSKATRALSETFGVTDPAQQQILLFKGEDGRWGFSVEAAQTLNVETVAREDAAVAALGNNFSDTEKLPAEQVKSEPVVLGAVFDKPADKVMSSIVETNKANAAPAAPVKKLSAKNHIRKMFTEFAPGGAFTMSQLCGTSYSEANIKTALSDLKNKLYADGDVLIVKRTRSATDGLDYYSI